MESFDKRSNAPFTLEECAKLVISTVPTVMGLIRKDMRAGRPSELSVPQFRTLIYLQRHPGASVSDVADHLGLALSTTSQLIDNLLKREYVTRETVLEDRRRATLSLTETGQAMLEVIYAKAQAQMKERLVSLSPEERKAISKAMLAFLRISQTPSEQKA